MIMTPDDANRILFVDDDPFILSSYRRQLRRRFSMETAASGEEGCASLERDGPFAVVVADMRMPGMSGIDFLRKVKSRFPDVVRMMLTGNADLDLAVTCVNEGSIFRFLTKPCRPETLTRSLEEGVEQHRLITAEKIRRRELEQKIRERTREIEEARKNLAILNRAKSDFLNLISHELRTPLTSAMASRQLLVREDLDREKMRKLLRSFDASLYRLNRIVDQALLLTDIQISGGTKDPEPVPLQEILVKALGSLSKYATYLAGRNDVSFGDIPRCDDEVLGDRKLLPQAFAALLETAVKFSARGETIRVSTDTKDAVLFTLLETSGPRIPEEILPTFFEVFSITNPITPGGDLGLGPPVAERIVRLFGGSVRIENVPGKGIRFLVGLKLAHHPDNLFTVRPWKS